MQTIEWRSELNTGIDKVDEDHRQLITLTNRLINAIENDVPKSEILKIFDELEAYTVYHFEREESYMKDHTALKETAKYIKHHKAQHKYFIDELPKLREKLIATNERSVTYDTVEFLLHWLLDHIIKEDLRLRQFIQLDEEARKNPSLWSRIGSAIKSHTNLQHRFLLIFSIPLIFLVIQSTFVSIKAYTKYQEREKIQQITNSIISMNSSITQLQKERGLSSAYISSNYTHFYDALQEQRQRTSEVIKRNFSSKTIIEQYIDVSKAIKTLQQLPKVRKMIDTHRFSKTESIDYYTHFIDILINMIKEISYLPFNTIDKHTYGPILLLLNLNEIHGLIRNEGISCLETQEPECPYLEQLYAKKLVYETALKRIATDAMAKALNDIESQPVSEQIRDLKEHILQKDISGHDAARSWFALTSRWIDGYNTIIEKTLQQINQDALKEKESFTTIIQRIWISFLFMVIFIIISIYLLKRSIILPIENITKALHKLSVGDKSIFFTTMTYKDAISRMERAYNQLRNSLIKADYASILMYLQEMKTQKYAKLSDEDALTGIYNRRAFLRIMAEQMHLSQKEHTPLSLAVLDIDHFKKINDTYGHDSGDIVLERFTEAVKKMLRNEDIFARVGGEEFALLLPKTAKAEACKIAERIRKEVSGITFEEIDPALLLTVSIGVADYQENIDMKTLFQYADKKLYNAKHTGRNKVCC